MFKKGDIYWCNFDNNTNNSEAHTHVQLGFRPVLIISRSDFNKEIILVAPLTSKKKGYNTHMAISKDKYANLRGDSYILLEQIRSIDANTLGSLITQLDEFDIFKLDVKLNMFLNLFDASENKFSKEIFSTARYLYRLDGFISLCLEENFSFNGEDMIYKLINKREKKIKYLKTLCEKLDIDIRSVYKEPKNIDEILAYLNEVARKII